jgi:hypothetical protein
MSFLKNYYIIRKRPEICPVCQGEGKYRGKICHGCDGKGWVVIDEGYWTYYPDWTTPIYPGGFEAI